jgi:hypothetical protein
MYTYIGNNKIWENAILLKRRVTSQKTPFFIVTAVKTSNLTRRV